MKVLIVDDSSTNLKLLRAILEAEDYQVVEAADGLQALAMMDRERVDAIISDILMPRMDGYRLCYEVRKSDRWHSLPFIFYTATYTSPSDERLCYDLGGDKYLKKPATTETLLAALTGAIVRAGQPRPAHNLPISESEVTNEYSERLVSKLEAKNVELGQAKARLEEANRRLEQTSAELQKANEDLELRVRARTAELQSANEILEAYAYQVSHDLRSPLRLIVSCSATALREGAQQLDAETLKRFYHIHGFAERLDGLVEAMLELAHVSSTKLDRQPVDLSALAEGVFAECRQIEPDRAVEITIAPRLRTAGDQRLLRVALDNLIGNAFKFTSKRADARVEFGRVQGGANSPYFIRDNGAGFDMAYVGKLFTAFQRLHLQSEFKGTGIGLATVQRIIQRHGGKIWAEGIPNHGATFYFTLGEQGPAGKMES